ncbi:Ubiquitin fusion degradation protein 4 [Allomyces arbusculus]|nr:Ubiquitin fusion degradation protein 4 [Allomyces arbusculus]
MPPSTRRSRRARPATAPLPPPAPAADESDLSDLSASSLSESDLSDLDEDEPPSPTPPPPAAASLRRSLRTPGRRPPVPPLPATREPTTPTTPSSSNKRTRARRAPSPPSAPAPPPKRARRQPPPAAAPPPPPARRRRAPAAAPAATDGTTPLRRSTRLRRPLTRTMADPDPTTPAPPPPPAPAASRRETVISDDDSDHDVPMAEADAPADGANAAPAAAAASDAAGRGTDADDEGVNDRSGEDSSDHDNDDDDDENEDDDEDDEPASPTSPSQPQNNSYNGNPAGVSNRLMGLFAGSSMSGVRALATQFHSVATQLSAPDPTELLMALQVLSELLLMNQEETLTAVAMVTMPEYTPSSDNETDGDGAPTPVQRNRPRHVLDSIARRLVALVAPPPDDDAAQFAHALLGSEAALMSVRCINALLDAAGSPAAPGHANASLAANVLGRAGAIPALVGALRNLEYIDVAEAAIGALHKLVAGAAQNGPATVRGFGARGSSDAGGSSDDEEGGAVSIVAAMADAEAMPALFEYLDFYPMPTQRLAAQIVAACAAHPRGAVQVIRRGVPEGALLRNVLERFLDGDDATLREAAVQTWGHVAALVPPKDLVAFMVEKDGTAADELQILAGHVRRTGIAAALRNACVRTTTVAAAPAENGTASGAGEAKDDDAKADAEQTKDGSPVSPVSPIAEALVQAGVVDTLLNAAGDGTLSPTHVRLLTVLVDAEVASGAARLQGSSTSRARHVLDCLLNLPAAPTTTAGRDEVVALIVHVLERTARSEAGAKELVDDRLIRFAINQLADGRIAAWHALPLLLVDADPEQCQRHGLVEVKRVEAATAPPVQEDDADAETAPASPTPSGPTFAGTRRAVDFSTPVTVAADTSIADMIAWELMHSRYFINPDGASTLIDELRALPTDQQDPVLAHIETLIHDLVERHLPQLPHVLTNQLGPQGRVARATGGTAAGQSSSPADILVSVIRLHIRTVKASGDEVKVKQEPRDDAPAEPASPTPAPANAQEEPPATPTRAAVASSPEAAPGSTPVRDFSTPTTPRAANAVPSGAADDVDVDMADAPPADTPAAEAAEAAAGVEHEGSDEPDEEDDDEGAGDEDEAMDEDKANNEGEADRAADRSVSDMHVAMQAVAPIHALLRYLKVKPEDVVVTLHGHALDPQTSVFRAVYQYLQRQAAETAAESGSTTPQQVSVASVFQTLFHVEVVPRSEWTGEADTAKTDTVCPPLPETLARILDWAASLHNAFPLSVRRPSVALARHVHVQLAQVLLAATRTQPPWLDALLIRSRTRWLLPFTLRRAYFESQCLGYARCVTRAVPAAAASGTPGAQGGNGTATAAAAANLGRIQRQKVRISRDRILGAAVKVMELFAPEYSMLEIEYQNEVGTGLGPTLEFYALVVAELAKCEDLWQAGAAPYLMPRAGVVTKADVDAVQTAVADAAKTASPLEHRTASPLEHRTAVLEAISKCGARRPAAQYLRMLGQLMAKALLDDRLVDVPLHPRFLKMVFSSASSSETDGVDATLDDVRAIDPTLAKSLDAMLHMADAETDPNSPTLAIDALTVQFEFLGTALVPGGSDRAVRTPTDVREYVRLVSNHVAGYATHAPAASLVRGGFASVLPITSVSALFSTDEIAALVSSSRAGDNDEHWTPAAITAGMRADHGYHASSRVVQDLVLEMSAMDSQRRRAFVQWLTGAPRLPLGGWTALKPPFTVVERTVPVGEVSDAYLPSVMTCANYLKLPSYSSREVLSVRLKVAVEEGQGSFHLS